MIRAIDFFCGGGGMTYGLRKAGIKVLAGIDLDGRCRETYEFNNKPAKFIHEDITKLAVERLETGYKTTDGTRIQIRRNDDELLFVGCSPCQYWSIMHTDKTRSKDSKNLLGDFRKFVDYYKPGHVVIENVPGIVGNKESPLTDFIAFLADNGYSSVHKTIRANEYGVPQTRRRFVLIASRVNAVRFPEPVADSELTVQNFIGDKKRFPKIKAGTRDETDFCHTASGLSETNLRRLAVTEHDGGTRKGWEDTDLQLAVYKRHEGNEKFGFQDIYGRMFWNKPAPTITTRFYSLSNGRFGHPEQDRAISLREGATLQTFPLDYVFKAQSISDISRIIGNAVPPELARRIGAALLTGSCKVT
ncbi:MAG: DNA cytosine methyltransferase [Pyrinomonadaceae bacterium]